jgi:hypothetical protein
MLFKPKEVSAVILAAAPALRSGRRRLSPDLKEKKSGGPA